MAHHFKSFKSFKGYVAEVAEGPGEDYEWTRRDQSGSVARFTVGGIQYEAWFEADELDRDKIEALRDELSDEEAEDIRSLYELSFYATKYMKPPVDFDPDEYMKEIKQKIKQYKIRETRKDVDNINDRLSSGEITYEKAVYLIYRDVFNRQEEWKPEAFIDDAAGEWARENGDVELLDSLDDRHPRNIVDGEKYEQIMKHLKEKYYDPHIEEYIENPEVTEDDLKPINVRLLDDVDMDTYRKVYKYVKGHKTPEDQILGTGNAGTVLSTVVNITKDFIETAEPDLIYFTANEDSRQSAYRHLLKRLTRKTRAYAASGRGGISSAS